jgi:hypothetical protein
VLLEGCELLLLGRELGAYCLELLPCLEMGVWSGRDGGARWRDTMERGMGVGDACIMHRVVGKCTRVFVQACMSPTGCVYVWAAGEGMHV